VRASLVDATHHIALVSLSGGGLWTFNPTDGSTFSPIDDFGSFIAITDISQNPSNPNHILIGTGDEHNTVRGNGVFESLDGGTVFTQIASTSANTTNKFGYIRFIKFSPTTPNTLYLASNSKLYKSINLGASWTEVFDVGASTTITSLDFTANTGVILSVKNKGLYAFLTGDLGSFSLLTNGVPNDATGTNNKVNHIVVATHAGDRNIGYVLLAFNNQSKQMYKTIDGGISWIQRTDPPLNISQAWFCFTIGVHPTNPNIVIGGSVDWGYTTDGGITWEIGGGLEVDYHPIHFNPSNPDIAYIGYDQGIGRVDFGNYQDILVWEYNGTTWVPTTKSQPAQLELGKEPGFNTTQIYYGDYYPEQYGDSYIEGQQDGDCFIKLEGVLQKRVLVGDGGAIFINKQDPQKSFASTQSGNIKQTTNGLQTSINYTAVAGFKGNHLNWITQFSGNNEAGNQVYISNTSSIKMTKDNAATFSSFSIVLSEFISNSWCFVF